LGGTGGEGIYGGGRGRERETKGKGEGWKGWSSLAFEATPARWAVGARVAVEETLGAARASGWGWKWRLHHRSRSDDDDRGIHPNLLKRFINWNRGNGEGMASKSGKKAYLKWKSLA